MLDSDCEKRFTEIKEFISRVEKDFEKEIKENNRISYLNTWLSKNPEKRNALIKKYSKTPKGKIANKKRHCIRHKRYRDQFKLLTAEEIEQIKEIYINCPEGYVVDHVIPLSKGGAHHPSNLQYLTWQENRQKSDKLDWQKSA